jgi:hypothetical protein
LAFIDDDKGNPLFLAKWQIEFANLIGSKNYTWALNSRKCGKSTLLALKIAHYLCGPEKHRISGFAPTHGQDFVYEKCRKYIKGSVYLYPTFLDKSRGANDTADAILTSTGCEFFNRSISVNTGGSTARGEYGDIVYVDEIQEIDQSIMDTIVFPMLADRYSEKHLILIGTPNLYKNPHIESRWNNWNDDSKKDSRYGNFGVDCWRAIDEGCLDEAWVLRQQKELSPDDFAMEYEARFPDTSMRFFPLNLLESCRSHRVFTQQVDATKVYIMGVDWAKYLNKTQILVAEVDLKTAIMTLVEWVEFDPRVRSVDYELQVEQVKELFWKYKVSWIIPDTTSTQDAILDLMYRKSNYEGIPKACIYRHEADKEITQSTQYGYKATLVKNDEMWRNHKQQMVKGRIKIPSTGPRERDFFAKMLKEHHELIVRSSVGGYIRLEEPRNGSKDIAVTMAMMSIFLQKMDVSPASMHIGGW